MKHRRINPQLSRIGNRFSYKTLSIIITFLLIAIIALIKIGTNPKNKVSAAWWDESWHYRRVINLGNTGSNLTNFQASLALDSSSLITAGKMKSDCSDIRVTDNQGKLADYWITGCNTASTQVWARIPSIPTGGTTAFLYYGNPSASAVKVNIGTPDFPGLSCKSIIDAGNSTGNGTYWIDPTNGDFSDKFQAYCEMANDGGGWMAVTSSMINTEVGSSVTTTKTTNGYGGVNFQNIINNTQGCTGTNYYQVLLKDIIPWTQIKADYIFTGGNSCWSIFGNTGYSAGSNLTPFVLGTDVIRNQIKMGGTNGDAYDGVNSRCDNYTYNFWHSNQGVGTTRSAQVILRRSSMGSLAGLGTGTACVNNGYGWQYQNIFIKETSMMPSYLTSTTLSEEVSPAPMAYWKFDEGNGSSFYNSSGNYLTGSRGTGTWASEENCVSGKCMQFNSGTSASVGLDDRYNITSNVTYNVWVKVTGINANWPLIMGRDPHNAYGFRRNTNNNYIFFEYAYGACDGTAFTQIGAGTPTDNKWHMLTMTQDGSTIKVFFDAKQVGSASQSSFCNKNTIPFSIGNDFTGFVDEAKIYTYARTPDQIKADFSNGQNHISSSDSTSSNLGSANNNNNLSDGLVGYWKMDDAVWNGTANEVKDSSGSNNNGTAAGTTLPTISTVGKFGKAGNFDGVGGAGAGPVVNVVDSNSLDVGYSTPMTASFWVKNDSGACAAIIKKSGMWEIFRCSSTITVRYDGASPTDYTGTVPLANGQWYLVTVTRNIQTGKTILYINGQKDTEWTINLSAATTTNGIGIGGYYGGAWSIDGQLDDVRLYNRELSSSEVQQLYNSAPGPVAYYNFNENTGSTVNDQSGNNNNSTAFSGTPVWSTGKYGAAMQFNGSNYITFPASGIGANSGSFSTWINFPANYSACTAISNIGPFFIGSCAANRLNFDLTVNGSWVDGNWGNTTGFYINSVSANTWNHITVNWDNGIATIYLNGIPVLSKTYTAGPLTSTGGNWIGHWSNGNNYTGKIDEVKVYNYSRNPRQIIEDMNGGHPIGGSPVGSQLAYLKLDEGYGSTANNSGNQGSVFNTVFGPGDSAPTWSTHGMYNGALNFDGVNDYTQISNASLLNNSTAFTASVWIKSNNITQDQTILSANPPFFLRLSGSKFRIGVYTNSAWTFINGNATLNSNTWYHLTLTYDGAFMKSYINGVLDISTAKTGVLASFTTMYLGRPVPGGEQYPFNGLIDEVKIYNTALSADDIKLDYNRGASLQLGSLSANTGNTAPPTAASQEYCIPGDTVSCSPPVADWRFEENQGTALNDSSGNNYNGTFSGSPKWVPGKIGSALQFSNPNFVTTSADLDLQAPFTIEAWVNCTDVSSTSTIIGKSSNGTDSNYWMDIRSGGQIYFGGYGTVGEGQYVYTNGTPITNNNWYHIVGVDTGTSRDIYVNGIKQAVSGTATGTYITNNYGISIGNRIYSGSSNPFLGKIDQVKIFNYARTPSQISLDYNRGAPVGWWKLDECHGSTIYDSSGNSNGNISIGVSGTQTSVGTCTDNLATSAWNNGKTGRVNSSINFDGTDDYAVTGTIPSSDAFSLSVWFKAAQIRSNDRIYWGNGTDKAILAFSGTSGNLTWYMSSSLGNSSYKVTSRQINPTGWNNVVLVYNGSVVKCFINGIEDSVTAALTGTSPASSINLGTNYNRTSNWFNGQIDDVRAFTYALNPTQIKSLFNNGAITFSQ